MGVTCQLLLNNEGFSLYRAGQTVTGTVNYLIDKPTEFVSATVSLIGSGRCRWEEGSIRYRRVYIGTEEYVAQHIEIFQTKEHEIVTVQSGSYEFPFQFILPEDIPSSHQDTTGNIQYKVELKFTKSGFIKSSQKFSTIIEVYNDSKRCLPEPLIAGFKKEFTFSSKKKFVYIKGEIEKTFINAGEEIMLTVSVHNETDIPITGIRTELVNLMTYTSNCKNTLRLSTTINGSVREYPGVTKNTKTTFRYIIPAFPHLFSIHNSQIIIKEYKAKVTVKLPFPHTNASLELPVVINMVNNEPRLAEGNQPPSYWQVMNEDNNKSEDEVEEEEKHSNNGEKDDKDFELKPHSSKSKALGRRLKRLVDKERQ